MSKKLLFSLFVSIALVAVIGCDSLQDKPASNPVISEPTLNPADTLPNINISADSVNALGRVAMMDDMGRGPVKAAAGWQLYVPVPFYSQRDPHWSSKPLGFGGCGTTIGSAGCFLTSIAMCYAKMGYSAANPPALNDWSYGGRAHYAFYDGGCGNMIRLPQALQYPGMSRNCHYWFGADQIYSYLQRGIPVIARINGGAHYVVIFAFDGNRYWVKDPWNDWTNQDRPFYGSFDGGLAFGF
ncbi:MAG: C39 family peptidase [Patescibacteria group bacterium]